MLPESKLYMKKISVKTRNMLMPVVNLIRLVSTCCLDTRCIKGSKFRSDFTLQCRFEEQNLKDLSSTDTLLNINTKIVF